MGATGSSKSTNSNSVTSIQDGGTTIQLDSPLVYSDTEQPLSTGVRQQINGFENKHTQSKHEHSLLIMDDGSVVEQNRGTKKSVNASMYARQKADILTHNHPSSEGGLGGTFSDADLQNFVTFNQHMYRASAKEGTYVISKGQGYNKQQGQQFVGEYAKMLKAQDRQYNKIKKQINDDYAQEVRDLYADKSLTLAQKQKQADNAYNRANSKLLKEINKLHVNNHNWLTQNAKNYGFEYSLERR